MYRDFSSNTTVLQVLKPLRQTNITQVQWNMSQILMLWITQNARLKSSWEKPLYDIYIQAVICV